VDPNTGKIRPLDSKEEPKKDEVLFKVGEEVKLKECYFKVKAIYPDSTNEILLKGIPKGKSTLAAEEARASAALKEKLTDPLKPEDPAKVADHPRGNLGATPKADAVDEAAAVSDETWEKVGPAP